ncbi:MAG: DNA translocase FtsK [Anaerolineae bacterium]|nr:DNA translocase FtsK [Anaerolineae bacterium]
MEKQEKDWLDRFMQINLHFGRDASGVILLAIALMTFLAIIGISQGSVLTFWSKFLTVWFGWGSFLVALLLGMAGIRLLRRDQDSFSREIVANNTGKFISFTLLLLITLSLLSIVGSNSIERADSGLDGGRIGWGLATLAWMFAGDIWGTLILAVLWILAAMSTFQLWSRIERWLLGLAGNSPESTPIVDFDNVPEDELVPVQKKLKLKKKPKQLAPEFRKSLRIPKSHDNRPAKPPPRNEEFPPLSILSIGRTSRPDERSINQTAGLIEKTLSEFGIPAAVIGFRVGPTVTQFAVQPGYINKPDSVEEDSKQLKVRVAQIAALQKDIALALSAERLRIEAPVPGKPYVGIEVPNMITSEVRLRPLLESDAFYKMKSTMAIAMGRDISGDPLVADLAQMPHLLIAGATGSGKSVCITAIAACLAMNNSPQALRLVMIDSKRVELMRFNGLPHLYGKVETDIDRIMGVLRWLVVEMDNRYRLLESAKVRDLNAYNRKLTSHGNAIVLPRIVVIIDELADLMMSAPDHTEHNLVRLAQMGRATGIHLIVATQRPSTDVVTGLIKANFPARLAFAVVSGMDSRVILDATGAENLLGRGDMLFLNPEIGSPLRNQGVMVTDLEIEKLITHWQKVSDISLNNEPPWEKLLQEPSDGAEEKLIESAISLVQGSQRASTSLLQRRLRIGYPRAARILDQLEEMGIVGPSQGGGRERDVLLDGDGEYE